MLRSDGFKGFVIGIAAVASPRTNHNQEGVVPARASVRGIHVFNIHICKLIESGGERFRLSTTLESKLLNTNWLLDLGLLFCPEELWRHQLPAPKPSNKKTVSPCFNLIVLYHLFSSFLSSVLSSTHSPTDPGNLLSWVSRTHGHVF